MGIASQPVEHLLKLAQYFRASHLLLAATQPIAGRALDIPTNDDGRYRRVVLVTQGTRTPKMFTAVEDSEPSTSTHHLLSWLDVIR